MENIKETDEYIVVEFTNDSGKKYEVGYPKISGYTKENVESEISNANKNLRAKASRGSSVSSNLMWIENGDSHTPRSAIDMGIVGGYVTKDNGIIYTYRLTLANGGGYGFTFTDQSKDTYHCFTPRNGIHYIDYNSEHPSIIRVEL